MSWRGRYVAVLVGGALAIAAPTALSLTLDRAAAAPRSAEAAPSAAPAASAACTPDAAQDCERRAQGLPARGRPGGARPAAARRPRPPPRAPVARGRTTPGRRDT